MNQKLQVFGSNSVNRHGFRIAVSALEGGQWDNALSGVPAHVGHDVHKLIGWVFPYGLYIEYGLVRSLGRMIMPEDYKRGIPEFINARNNLYSKHIQEEFEEHKEAFLPLIKKHLTGDQRYFSRDIFLCRDNDIVYKIFPKIRSKLDKHGLVFLEDLLSEFEYMRRGVFKSKSCNLAIVVHPSFRRSFSYYNSVHFGFLEEFFSLKDRDGVRLRIAIDWDFIGYAPSFSPMEELDYWWGPKFDDDIAKMPLGLTRHEGNDLEKTYYGISATEFLWKADGTKKEFELEEIREDLYPLSDETFKCRYIHSIFDTESNVFDHFDGATRSYHGDSYLSRICSKMTDAGKGSDYEKLFRIDGNLDLDTWKSLVTNYLQGNPLIYEYFNQEKPTGSKRIDKESLSVRQSLVPYSMDKGDDVRILLSYHPKSDQERNGHIVSIVDHYVREDLTVEEVVEYDIIELKKLFQRKGSSLIIPDGLHFAASQDRYWNIPCIFHGYADPENEISFTLDCIKEILEGIDRKSYDLVVSFTLAWNEQDKEIRLSVMGQVSDIVLWMNETPKIETNRQKLREWLQSQEDRGRKIEKERAININKPFLEEVGEFDGVLYMRRLRVNQKYDLHESEEGLEYTMHFEEEGEEIKRALEKGEILAVAGYYVQEAKCSKTGLSYWNSPHIRFVDEGVHLEISKCNFNGLFWSDRRKF